MARKHRKTERKAEMQEVRSGELGTVGALVLMLTVGGEPTWPASLLLAQPNPMRLDMHQAEPARLLERLRDLPDSRLPVAPPRPQPNAKSKADRK